MNDTNTLTLGSLFSGSGGFELGAVISGIVPVWNSEIEPFAIAVTSKRFSSVRHYGDVSTLSGAELEPVDIITFGSPCQDMSIAGKRAGLEGSRSNLFYEAIRIVKEMRDATDGKYPRNSPKNRNRCKESQDRQADNKVVKKSALGQCGI